MTIERQNLPGQGTGKQPPAVTRRPRTGGACLGLLDSWTRLLVSWTRLLVVPEDGLVPPRHGGGSRGGCAGGRGCHAGLGGGRQSRFGRVRLFVEIFITIFRYQTYIVKNI